jgi:outer membrane protein TolC
VKRIAAGLAALVVLGAPHGGFAETLEEAWRLALERNAALAAAGAEVEFAEAQERAARAARWPRVEASASRMQLADAPAFEFSTPSFGFRSPPIFADDRVTMAAAQVRVPLYTGGQVSAGIAAAREASRGASEEQRRTIAALKIEVARAYVDLLRSRRALEAAQSNAKSLAAHVADVQVMVERESVATADLLAARVAFANAEQARLRAANAVALAQAAYNRRIGEPLDRAPMLDERLPADARLATEPVEQLVGRALAARSELRSLDARAQALEAQSRAELGRLLPQLGLSAGYTHLGNEFLDREDFSMIGVGLTWNLFDGGESRNRAAALRAQSRAARHRFDDLRSLVALEVRDAWLGVQEAQARIAVTREAVAQAEENLRMSRELYGAGLATNTQVLDAVALQVAAANNRDDAILDESLAHLELERAVGEL